MSEVRFRIPDRKRVKRKIPPGSLPAESSYNGYIAMGLDKADWITPELLQQMCDSDMRIYDAKPKRIRNILKERSGF